MSIVKESSSLRKAIHERLKEIYPNVSAYGFKQAMVINDAKERGFVITASALSRYIGDNKKNSSLSEAQILWLSIRYGLPVRLLVGKIQMEEGKIITSIPKFNELEALKQLKIIFG